MKPMFGGRKAFVPPRMIGQPQQQSQQQQQAANASSAVEGEGQGNTQASCGSAEAGARPAGLQSSGSSSITGARPPLARWQMPSAAFKRPAMGVAPLPAKPSAPGGSITAPSKENAASTAGAAGSEEKCFYVLYTKKENLMKVFDGFWDCQGAPGSGALLIALLVCCRRSVLHA